GGGYYLVNANSSTISNLIFRANTAVDGGALCFNGGSPTINNVSFFNNAASNAGAGIFNFGSANPTLNNLNFSSNTANNGGGLYVNSGTVTVNNSVFSGNTSNGPLGGGGVYVSNGGANANLTKVVFSGNTAPNGGGMYTVTSNPTLSNVIFTGNSASTQGGGFFNTSSSNPKLVNVTFNGNTAPAGSAFYNSSGTPVFVNVLLWNNIFGNIALPGSQGNLQAGADPFFNSADPDGADNLWFTADDGLALNAGMPGTAIDQGIASFGGVTIPSTDAAGIARPHGALYDPGAYEQPYQPLSLNISSGSSSDQVIITGTNLSGATAVKFNGRDAASFTIDNSTQITARVPFGLVSSGKVSLITPSGPAVSSNNFTITSRIHLVRASASGNSSGTNWTNAHTSLQTALTNAVAGDEIWVAAGTYKPVVPVNPASVTLAERQTSFQLKASVAVYGGFAGSETSRAARNFAANLSVLSGDIDAVADVYDTDASNGLSHLGLGGNSLHVVKGITGATLDGFTIQGGFANGAGNDGKGGGMFNENSNPSLSNLIVRANTAAITGGGIHNESSHPTLNQVIFRHNASLDQGGGMFNFFSTPNLTQVIFEANAAVNRGGGLYEFHPFAGSSSLNKVIFVGNTTTGLGGGVFSDASTPLLSNVVFANNQASSGGGFYNLTSGVPKFVNTTFSGNGAGSGSGIYISAGSPVLVNTLLVNQTLFNLVVPGGQGNLVTGSDPFVNSADPDGPDNLWFTADDGLQLNSSEDSGIASFGGVTVPTIDILGVPRPQGAAHDTGAYEKP
ncbi:MAG: hypothetical protein CVV27_15630, partial [Candidatus Melainabacteria bacterium HGW-Melainabacteria-1]